MGSLSTSHILRVRSGAKRVPKPSISWRMPGRRGDPGRARVASAVSWHDASVSDGRHPRMQSVSEEARVTPIELFCDLVFVFSLTQVTALMAGDLTGRGLTRA